jgi:hypothetical protein
LCTRAIRISENKWDEYDSRTVFPFGYNKICQGFYKCDCRRGLSVNATRVFRPQKLLFYSVLKGENRRRVYYLHAKTVGNSIRDELLRLFRIVFRIGTYIYIYHSHII